MFVSMPSQSSPMKPTLPPRNAGLRPGADAACDSNTPARRARFPRGVAGLTLIELIGVMAIIALVAGAVIVSIIRRVDHAAWTREKADLQAMADSYLQCILRNKTITNVAGMPAAIAKEMSLANNAITTTPRGWARAFLVDRNLRINGAVLPYSQTTAGSSVRPVSPRAIIVSSMSGNLPISTSDNVNDADFQAIWDTPERAKPPTPSWSTWPNGEDVVIKKLNFEPLFHQLILIDHDNAADPRYSIESGITNTVPVGGLGWNSHYLDGSALSLHGADEVVQVRHILTGSISFVFENGGWRGQVEGGQTASATALDFLHKATLFFNSAPNTGVNQGASQYSVIVTMYTFMFDYTLWANEQPCFNRHGSSSLPPEYELLYNIGGNSRALHAYSGAGVLLKLNP